MTKEKLIKFLQRMARTYDGNTVELDEGNRHEESWAFVEDICNEAADALKMIEPVRHGLLEYDFSASIDETMWYYRCTSCGGYDIPYGDWSYCPHCGAKIEDVIN